MADSKISDLPAAAALVGTEPVPIVQSGVTVQTTVSDIATVALITSEPTSGPFTVTTEDIVYCNSGFSNTVALPSVGIKRITVGCDATSDVTGVTSPAGVEGVTVIASDTARVFFFTTTDGWRQQ